MFLKFTSVEKMHPGIVHTSCLLFTWGLEDESTGRQLMKIKSSSVAEEGREE